MIRIASIDDECWVFLTQIHTRKLRASMYTMTLSIEIPCGKKATLQEVLEGKIKITDLRKRAKEVPVGDQSALQRLWRKRFTFLKVNAG